MVDSPSEEVPVVFLAEEVLGVVLADEVIVVGLAEEVQVVLPVTGSSCVSASFSAGFMVINY